MPKTPMVSARRFCCVMFLAVFVPALVASNKANNEKKQEEAKHFLDRVRELTDIRAAGSPPFHLKARVEAASLASGKPPYVGSLVLIWQSPSQWREEIGLPGYTQVRVASGGKLWTSRNLPYEPLRVYQIEKLIDIRSEWTLRPDETISASKDRKHKGLTLRCVRVQGKGRGQRELCANSSTLLPESEEPAVGVTLFDPSWEYGRYVGWENKQFPREMKSYEDGKLAVSVEGDLTSLPSIDASTFAQPYNASEWDSCDNADPPSNPSEVVPHYPDTELQNRKTGMVSVYAVVGTNGSLSNLAIVRSAGREFDASTEASVKQWRYRPAMCGSNPVPFETVIEVRYTLSE